MPNEAYATESFNFSHIAVKKEQIPFLRLCKEIHLPAPEGEHIIYKLDVRCILPNCGTYMSVPVLHTVEHIVADYINANLQEKTGLQSLDFSPMGCQTGFYWSVLRESGAPDFDTQKLCAFLDEAFAQAQTHTFVLAAEEDSCGNYLSHDLDGAKALCKQLSALGFKPYVAG